MSNSLTEIIQGQDVMDAAVFVDCVANVVFLVGGSTQLTTPAERETVTVAASVFTQSSSSMIGTTKHRHTHAALEGRADVGLQLQRRSMQ